LVKIQLRRGDAPGTKTALERLVKLNPDNKQYKELLAALNKQVAETKKVGTLKSPDPKQPPTLLLNLLGEILYANFICLHDGAKFRKNIAHCP
jgi:hypothetical protein